MALNKKPVNGMKDILPEEMQIRDYVMGVIKENYRKFGFTPIETPCVESIGNLCSKQGGENEKLIFKILKRGEKLNLETAKEENDLVDSGLRYDLTLPLSRYYANHANELPNPFKALQMGNVWRADRPQKGRFRQFMQRDGFLGNLEHLRGEYAFMLNKYALGDSVAVCLAEEGQLVEQSPSHKMWRNKNVFYEHTRKGLARGRWYKCQMILETSGLYACLLSSLMSEKFGLQYSPGLHSPLSLTIALPSNVIHDHSERSLLFT